MRDNWKPEKEVDEIMKTALASEVEPEEELNRRIIQQWKERSDMKKQVARRIYALATACFALLITVSVGAAVKYLRPAEAAEKSGIESEKIKAAFEGENAMELNESQEAGDYRFTLLGITTAENLEESELSDKISAQGEIYAVVAIERLDGTPMPSIGEDAYDDNSFFISPLIEGLTPWQYNIASMNGAYSDFVENGIMYRVILCDDVSKFADRNLHLCVIDEIFYDTNAYYYEETTGEIARNENYDGINLLFDLPIDPTRADEAAAAEYLKELEASWESGTGEGDESVGAQSAEAAKLTEDIIAQISNGNEEEALEGAVLLDHLTKTVTGKDGVYEYEFTVENQTSSSLEQEVSNIYFYEDNFKNGRDVYVSYMDYDESTDQFQGIYIMVLKDNGDGTAEIKTYQKSLLEEK